MGTWVEAVFLDSLYHTVILLSGADNIPDLQADKARHDLCEQPHSALGYRPPAAPKAIVLMCLMQMKH